MRRDHGAAAPLLGVRWTPLFGANGDAVEVGQGTVRGVPATRYRLTVDASLLPGRAV